MKRRPIIVRLWRIFRMALGLIFSPRELWTVVEAADEKDAVYAARKACPYPNVLSGIIPTRLPGFRDQWRVQYIYRGQP